MTSLPILQPPAVPTPTPRQHTAGPIERALDEVWRTARARMWTRGHLWRSFRLSRRFSLRFLDLSKVKLKVPTGQVPDCEACTEICCTGPNARVSLRLLDIARLTDAGFADRIVSDPPPAVPKSAGWARREADESVFHRVFPVLTRDNTGTCTFLTDERQCGLWPGWPLSCARYPYALDLQLKVIFWAHGCQSFALLEPVDAPPRVRALALAVIDAYNARIKDVVMLTHARPELEALGVLKHLRLDEFPL